MLVVPVLAVRLLRVLLAALGVRHRRQVPLGLLERLDRNGHASGSTVSSRRFSSRLISVTRSFGTDGSIGTDGIPAFCSCLWSDSVPPCAVRALPAGSTPAGTSRVLRPCSWSRSRDRPRRARRSSCFCASSSSNTYTTRLVDHLGPVDGAVVEPEVGAAPLRPLRLAASGVDAGVLAAVELLEHRVAGQLEGVLPLLGVLLQELRSVSNSRRLRSCQPSSRSGWALEGMKIGVNSLRPSIARFQLRA
jgi:hypothetical protein